MVDPYAIVRRLTGHELISPKDAQLLTEAVDGLIDQIGSKDTRIADLEAENERLASERDYWQSQHDERTRQLGQAEDEALSRTGAVKVKALEWKDIHQRRSDEDPTTEVVGYEAGIPGLWWRIDVEASDFSLVSPEYSHQTFGTLEAAQAAAQADYERRILSALEPAATEGQQPVAHAYVIDGECEQIEWGTEIGLPDDPSLVLLYTHPAQAQQEPVAWRWKPKDSAAWIYDPKHEWLEAQSSDEIDAEPLYTRPTVQAVTEAMVRAAAEILIGRVNAPEQEIYRAAAAALKAAMEVSDD